MRNEEYTLTIFTPTYNRAYILNNLYQSLVRQSSKDFYWLIVDDGSTDETEGLITEWIREAKIEIEYHKKNNGGKASAVNVGLDYAKGELFLCVDSDDFLSDDAVERIIGFYNKMDDTFVGIVGERYDYKTGESITKLQDGYARGTLNALYKLGVLKGDTMLIYRTNIINQYRYPTFENEKFVPDVYLYDLLDQRGELCVLRGRLYWSCYLEDGYTKSIKRTIFNSPNGYYAFIAQRLQFNTLNRDIFKDNIRCVTINIVRHNKRLMEGTRKKWFNFMVVVGAYVYYYKDYYCYEKQLRRG